MNPWTFFIYVFLKSGLLDLGKIELDRSRPPEDGQIDAHLLLLRLDLDDHAGEVRKRPLDDAHAVALLVGLARLGARGPFGHRSADALDLGLLDRLGIHPAEEAGDLGRVLDQ